MNYIVKLIYKMSVKKTLIHTWNRRILFVMICYLFCQNISAQNSLIRYQENSLIGYKNERAEVVVPPKYEAGSDFYEGFAVIIVQGKRGFLNQIGEEAIPPQYEDAGHFINGLACVKLAGKYGYINYSGKMVIPNIYDNAFYFSEKYAVVQIGNTYGVINHKGKLVIPFGEYDRINPCKIGKIGLCKEKMCGFITPKNKLVIPFEFTAVGNFDHTNKCRVWKGKDQFWIDEDGDIIEKIKPHQDHEMDERNEKNHNKKERDEN